MINNHKIIVTQTSWKKRIQYVSNSIKIFLSSSTIQPDIFYLWLSKEEFPNELNDLPSDLIVICKKFNIKIKWTDKNEKVHKRWRVYPEHYNDLVFSIDDDCIYSNRLIEDGLISYQLYPQSPCILWRQFAALPTYDNDIKNKKFIYTNAICDARIWLCGQCMFPPNTFPLESLTEEKILFRNKEIITNDEVWLWSFLIKNYTPITYIQHLTPYKIFEKSQDNALVIENANIKDKNGYSNADKLLYKCLKFNNSLNNFQKLFPNYNYKEIVEK